MTRKYEEIAEQISNWIFESAYGPGDRLPSIRTLSKTTRVSVTTVIAALRLLESRGLVEAKDRAGYFINMPSVRPGTFGPQRRANKTDSSQKQPPEDHLRLNLKHDEAILLGTATPADHYLPIRQIQKSLLRSARRASESLSYSFPGDPRYLTAVGRRMTSVGVTASASDIISTGGAQESLALALRSIAQPGDQVAVFVPASPGIVQAIRAVDLSVVEILCKDDGQPCLDTLEEVLKQTRIKAICISANASNPTGLTLSDGQKAKLLEIVYQRGIVVIEDDVYGDLFFGTRRPPPLKAFDNGDSVIYCSSFSKTVSPGLRAGWIMPGRFYTQVSDQKYFMNLSSPAVTQMALADYLGSGSHDLYLRKIRRTYQKNSIKLRDLVLSEFPEGTMCTKPDGGFALWVVLPQWINATDLYPIARNAGYCFAPGQIFSASGRFPNCLRLSGARPMDAAFEAGMVFLAKEFKKCEMRVRNRQLSSV